MPLSHDTILLETVRTRRARLRSALLHGGLADRRPVRDNLGRVVASLVAAAVACVGCVGFALVSGLIEERAAARPAPATAPAAPAPSGARP